MKKLTAALWFASSCLALLLIYFISFPQYVSIIILFLAVIVPGAIIYKTQAAKFSIPHYDKVIWIVGILCFIGFLIPKPSFYHPANDSCYLYSALWACIDTGYYAVYVFFPNLPRLKAPDKGP